jgi:hypothetical protein
METFGTDFRRAVEIFPPKCTRTGFCPRSADTLVVPLATAFRWLADRWVLALSLMCLLPLHVDLPCQVGPLCKCDAKSAFGPLSEVG